MTPEAAMLLAAALAAAEPPSGAAWPAQLSDLLAAPAYRASDRAVDNWRSQGALSLDLGPAAAIRFASEDEPTQPPRCVKLNNYWCIKRGGWTGEIAADGEGHVAFATAGDGAASAALLLRRYYVDFKRRSARAIVARWAPANCAPLSAGVFPATKIVWPARPAPPPPKTERAAEPARKPAPHPEPRSAAAPASAGLYRMMPQRVVSMGLAPFGLENTLRARWLAAHGRGGPAARPVAGPAKAKRAPAKTAALPALAPAAEIAVGLGERRREQAPPKLAPARPQPTAPTTNAPDPPRPLADMCAGERERLANYAARVIEGVAAGPDDDLALFTAEGAPTDNLAKVMANMAAVEIGPMRASNALIAAGIAQMMRQSARQAAASSPLAPLADNAPLPPRPREGE
jgi:hypothetical protein